MKCIKELERYIKIVKLRDGTTVKLRPIKPEDKPFMLELFKTFSTETIRFRFFIPIREMTYEDLKRYCNIDYDNEFAIVAESRENKRRRIIGVARFRRDKEDKKKAEFAVVVGDPWQGKGLGTILTEYIIEIAKDKGILRLHSRVLKDNYRALQVSKKFGFEITDIGVEEYEISLKLN